MLEVVGAASLDELMHQTIPDAIRMEGKLQLDAPLSESEALRELRDLPPKTSCSVPISEWAIMTLR